MIGAAFGVGFIIGPAAGGLLGSLSPRAPFWAAAVLSMSTACTVCLSSRSPWARRIGGRFRCAPQTLLALSVFWPATGWVLLMAGSIALAKSGRQALQSTWVLYTTYRFHWTELDNGLSLALLGVASILVQVGLIGKLVPAIGEKKAIWWGMVFNFGGFIGFALANRGWMMIAVMLVWSISFIAGPTTQSLVSKEYGPDEQGAVQGALTSLQSLTGVFGPILATYVFGYFTSKSAPIIVPGAAFFQGAVLIALSALLIVMALRARPADAPA